MNQNIKIIFYFYDCDIVSFLIFIKIKLENIKRVLNSEINNVLNVKEKMCLINK